MAKDFCYDRIKIEEDIMGEQQIAIVTGGSRGIGQNGEVAKVVSFLCSDDASYLTGQVISVNGRMF